MFSTLRRLLVLSFGTVVSGLMFAPVAFAMNEDGGGTICCPSTPTHAHHAAGGSSLATWQWTLISVGIVAAVALIVAATVTVRRRSKQSGTLRPRMP